MIVDNVEPTDPAELNEARHEIQRRTEQTINMIDWRIQMNRQTTAGRLARLHFAGEDWLEELVREEMDPEEYDLYPRILDRENPDLTVDERALADLSLGQLIIQEKGFDWVLREIAGGEDAERSGPLIPEEVNIHEFYPIDDERPRE